MRSLDQGDGVISGLYYVYSLKLQGHLFYIHVFPKFESPFQYRKGCDQTFMKIES